MTLRHRYKDGGGGGQRGGWGECDSLRPGEEVMPGIYMCVCLCTHTRTSGAHTIQMLRDVAWTLPTRRCRKQPTKRHWSHPDIPYFNLMDTDYTGVHTHTHSIHLADHILPRQTSCSCNTQPSKLRHAHTAKAYRTHLTPPAHAADGHTWNTRCVPTTLSYRQCPLTHRLHKWP